MISEVTKQVIADLERTDREGQEKYGHSMDRKDYTHKDWLQEAYEECIDKAKYLKAAMNSIEE